jgi:E3 ubiquitin-protein ligase UBR1/E3 ubiquitin-protein ligase UBR3
MRNVDPEFSSQKDIFDEYPTDNIAVNIGLSIRMDSSNAASDPLSIHEVLVDLLGANDCARLVDSVNHVLELLCLSTNEKSGAPEVDSQANEDIQRKLLKEQRQKAILETFAAKQNAFAAEFDYSDDEDDFNEGTQVEVSSTADESFPQSGNGPASEKAVVSMADADYVAMETSTEAKECVLCKRKKDDKNSSTCWIALVQRYNFPRQVLDRGTKVAKISDVTSAPQVDQSPEVRMNDGLGQLVTVGSLTDSDNSTKSYTPIDLSTIEHVQCCGHQMHLDCYQGHMKNLQLNHPGYGVVDPAKSEFQCPTCRRLANVLLPDMEASLLTKRPDVHEEGKGIEETEKSWIRFWHANKNLERAVEFFCDQVVRVQTKSPQKAIDQNKFEISQALWEGLVLNVMHCEVETRDGPGKSDSSASSSSAPIRLADESTWGGDPAHWRALRELGRLAMLSNTLPGAVQDRQKMLRELRKCLGLADRRDSGVELETSATLERIILDIFPESSYSCEEPLETTEATDMAIDTPHYQEESTIPADMSVSTPLPCLISVHETEERHEHQMDLSPEILTRPIPIDRQERQEHKMEPSPEILTGPIPIHRQEDNKRPKYAEPEPHRGNHQAATAAPLTVPSNHPLQKFNLEYEEPVGNEVREEHKLTGCPSNISSQEQKPDNSLDAPENRLDWIPNTMRNGVLSTDPLMLLALLLIIFTGQPDRRSLLSMVKFAYTAAVLQTQLAVTELGVDGAMVETLVQRACLPFLRRAAMLVQIVTRESFGGQHGLSGTNVLEFRSLQLALQLPDCADILHDGSKPTLATELLRPHKQAPDSLRFELRQVPHKALLHKLPEVFQELLLVNIHNKKLCSSCGEMPADPAICLICGELLCCDADCCRDASGIGECSQHAAEESAGVGIFLLLRSTQLLLLRNNRTCMGLSLYLDIHGEEDLYLRRSQLLYLSDLRLNEVRRLWMTAAFDYDSYILRNSQSRPNVY